MCSNRERIDKISNWVLEWFKRRGVIENIDEKHINVNYFESGWIDSLGVIEFILDIESHFHINFSAEHFQDRRFSIIKGLAEIIYELLKSKR